MILNRFVSYHFPSKPIVLAVEGGGQETTPGPPPQTEILLFRQVCPSMTIKGFHLIKMKEMVPTKSEVSKRSHFLLLNPLKLFSNQPTP